MHLICLFIRGIYDILTWYLNQFCNQIEHCTRPDYTNPLKPSFLWNLCPITIAGMEMTNTEVVYGSIEPPLAMDVSLFD